MYRGPRDVLATMVANTAVKYMVGRARPLLRGCRRSPARSPAAPTRRPTPPRRSRRRGCSRRPAGAAALRGRLRDGAVAPLPGRALPLRHRRGRAARRRPGPPRRTPMKVGIVGLPNAGKSSLFNALTRAGAQAANYPFTTVEPNVAVVPVPDERLDRVAETIGATPVVHETIEFHDIAGLVRGATGARGSATSSWATSARPTRSCTWSARTTTRRWCTRRAAWTRSPTWTTWTPSCCSPTSSRPSAGSSGCPSRHARSTR